MVKSYMTLLDFYLNVHAEVTNDSKTPSIQERYSDGKIAYFDLFGKGSEPIQLFPLFPDIQSFVHQHDFFEIVYIYRGECSIKMGDQRISLKAGDACIINVDVRHEFLPFQMYDDMIFIIAMSRESLKTVYLDLLSLARHEFFASFFLSSMQQINKIKNYVLFRSDSESDYEVYIRQILKNQISGGVFSHDILLILSAAMLIEFARQYSKNIAEESKQDLKDKDISAIVTHILQNCRTVSIRSLAKLVGYNESYLSSLIKKYSGSSFSDILHSARFFTAARLLIETDKSVSEIMEEVGYSNRSWFTKKFEERFGMKPQEFRSAQKKKVLESIPL